MHDSLEHIFISGVGCNDWDSSFSADDRFNTLIPKLRDGDIILLHDFNGNDSTVEALKRIIPELKRLGYGFVTISRLFEIKKITPKAHSGYIYTNVLQSEPAQYR